MRYEEENTGLFSVMRRIRYFYTGCHLLSHFALLPSGFVCVLFLKEQCSFSIFESVLYFALFEAALFIFYSIAANILCLYFTPLFLLC